MKILVPVLLVIIIILTAGLFFFVGKSSTTNNIVLEAPAPTLTSETTATATFTPTAVPMQKVTGGGVMSFPKYELTIPADWQVVREVPGPDSERVIVKGGGYELSILEGGFGGSVCLYPGDADSEGPSARYDSFKEITAKSGDKLRRSWTGSELTAKYYTICHLTQYGWGAPTLFGAIGIKTPTPPTADGLAVLDQILASFTRL